MIRKALFALAMKPLAILLCANSYRGLYSGISLLAHSWRSAVSGGCNLVSLCGSCYNTIVSVIFQGFTFIGTSRYFFHYTPPLIKLGYAGWTGLPWNFGWGLMWLSTLRITSPLSFSSLHANVLPGRLSLWTPLVEYIYWKLSTYQNFDIFSAIPQLSYPNNFFRD